MRIFIAILFNLIVISLFSQINRCSTTNYSSFLNTKYINRTSIIQKVEKKYLRKEIEKTLSDNEQIVIPVVFHIIGNSSVNKITELNIEEQLNILNEDYGKIEGTNGYGNGVNMNITFCKASVDETGSITDGIVYIYGNYPGFNHILPDNDPNSDLSLKSLSHWNANKYLNIYIAELTGGVLGYATFPWDLDIAPERDGVVIDPDFLGYSSDPKYNLGRTCTHEVGHWLGLYHPFQKGINNNETSCENSDCSLNGDLVCDTPPVSAPNFNCPCVNSCHSDNPDINDLVENYMDYTDDVCMNMFTQGQKERVWFYLSEVRNYRIFANCEISHCFNGIQDENETDIDCGGFDCLPCSGNSGVNPDCHIGHGGFGMSINGNTSFSEIPCVDGNIVMGYYLPDCRSVYVQFPLHTTNYHWNDDFPSFITDKGRCHINYPLGIKHYKCDYIKVFISIIETDEYKNSISQEYSEWIFMQVRYLQDPGGFQTHIINRDFSGFIINQEILNQLGIQFISGHYYRIKIAGSGDEINSEWTEDVRYFMYLKDNLYIDYNISNDLSANNIIIANTTITNDQIVTASNSIIFKSGSTIKAGVYKITPNNCSEILVAKNLLFINDTLPEQDYIPCPCINFTNISSNNEFNEIDNILKVYPNPTKRYITIKSENLIEKYSIETIIGNIIKSNIVNNYSTVIDLFDLKEGAYTLNIYISEKLITKKIIKFK